MLYCIGCYCVLHKLSKQTTVRCLYCLSYKLIISYFFASVNKLDLNMSFFDFSKILYYFSLLIHIKYPTYSIKCQKEGEIMAVRNTTAQSDNNRITYRQGLSSKELGGYMKSICVPIIVFLVALIVISKFGDFGKSIMAPASSLMWLMGVAAAWKIPSQRKETLSQTYIGVAGYVLGLALLRFLIGIAATTSSEQLMATYSQAMPTSTGSTISGFLQSMLWILAFMTPITFISMQAKKFVTFRRTIAKDKVLQQIRGLRHK